MLILPSMLFSEVKISTTTKYYNIYPKSKKDLKRALFDKTTITVGKKKYLGLTQWRIKPKYWFNMENNVCKITTADVLVKITFTMPKIASRHHVDYNTKNAFNRFYKKLFAHEKNHKKYAIKAARAINKKLERLKVSKNCDKLKKAGKKASDRIMKKYSKQSSDYDKRTDHGLKEGASIDRFI